MALAKHLGVLLIFLAQIALSQTNEEFIHGFLLDSESGEPIVFATIRLKERAVGVISNKDGSFRIPSKFLDLGEILVISCLGYETLEQKLGSLSKNTNSIIKLRPSVEALKETIVVGKRKRPPSPRKILKRAIERIPMNYPTQPFAQVGYYRDYQTKEQGYLNLNEAIIKVFDAGFETNDFLSSQSQILNYRINDEFERDSDAVIAYDYSTNNKIIDNARLFSFGGNEFNILRIHDAIRNYKVKTFSYVDVLEKDLLRNHSLERKKDVSLGDEKLFVIGLASSNSAFRADEYIENKSIKDIRATGNIYISQSSYAIHKMTYKMYDHTESQKVSNKKKDKKPKLLYEIAIEYKDYGDKMYLNYLSVHNAFKVRKSYFRVENILFDIQKKRFVLKTNKPAIFLVQPDQPNVVVKYKKKRLRIQEVRNTQDGIMVLPYNEQIDKILDNLKDSYGNIGKKTIDVFDFEFYNIVDEFGNTLNEYVYEEYDQYREFFSQQVITDSLSKVPTRSLMIKDRPIFENQPMAKQNNFEDYWMNTPLKKVE